MSLVAKLASLGKVLIPVAGACFSTGYFFVVILSYAYIFRLWVIHLFKLYTYLFPVHSVGEFFRK